MTEMLKLEPLTWRGFWKGLLRFVLGVIFVPLFALSGLVILLVPFGFILKYPLEFEFEVLRFVLTGEFKVPYRNPEAFSPQD